MTTEQTKLKPLFELGQVVATPGALAAMKSKVQMLFCLQRHLTGDWGDIDQEDWAMNDAAIKDGSRILSAYPIDASKPSKGYGENCLWIITESDRSVTTLLLPDEY
jgi:hypothetical protein